MTAAPRDHAPLVAVVAQHGAARGVVPGTMGMALDSRRENCPAIGQARTTIPRWSPPPLAQATPGLFQLAARELNTQPGGEGLDNLFVLGRSGCRGRGGFGGFGVVGFLRRRHAGRWSPRGRCKRSRARRRVRGRLRGHVLGGVGPRGDVVRSGPVIRTTSRGLGADLDARRRCCWYRARSRQSRRCSVPAGTSAARWSALPSAPRPRDAAPFVRPPPFAATLRHGRIPEAPPVAPRPDDADTSLRLLRDRRRDASVRAPPVAPRPDDGRHITVRLLRDPATRAHLCR